ncbi:hypothetical protein B0H17DRAFT_1213107 [Mycena rosella]|uniref:Uncharacterized protein n=1 Tax=Mycena rosella TaxID=1033263 RepID=A0AAD7CQS5_MYCRO|nr:hypothetical protein B0H17DRAFT_1213107 [Mycena rosella]
MTSARFATQVVVIAIEALVVLVGTAVLLRNHRRDFVIAMAHGLRAPCGGYRALSTTLPRRLKKLPKRALDLRYWEWRTNRRRPVYPEFTAPPERRIRNNLAKGEANPFCGGAEAEWDGESFGVASYTEGLGYEDLPALSPAVFRAHRAQT